MVVSHFVGSIVMRACKELEKDPTPKALQHGIDLDRLFGTTDDTAESNFPPRRSAGGHRRT